jgi:hypothetical protein
VRNGASPPAEGDTTQGRLVPKLWYDTRCTEAYIDYEHAEAERWRGPSGYMSISPKARDAYIPVYERALIRALQDILAAIPASQLAIQWDVCQDVLIYGCIWD